MTGNLRPNPISPAAVPLGLRRPLAPNNMARCPRVRAYRATRMRARAPPEIFMSKRMLIDANHPEETRVVVLDGSKVEEFDFEAATKRPLKGNIYLAKVTRVEPSLQAAFVEYGGNRQGFLAFSEIHPDYYQIPVADRQALLAEQEAEARRRQEDDIESFEITGAKTRRATRTRKKKPPKTWPRTSEDAAPVTWMPPASNCLATPRSLHARRRAGRAGRSTTKTTMRRSSSITAAPRIEHGRGGRRHPRPSRKPPAKRMSRLRRRSGNRSRRSGRRK